jgi:hypothetical protein
LREIVTDKERLPKLAIIVVSCDKYDDLWVPFFDLFKRFWPDCPFKTYLLSNRKEYSASGVNNILTGDDVSWSDNLLKGLKKIEEEYVLLLMEDLLFYERVDTPKVLSILAETLSRDPNYFRLMPSLDLAAKRDYLVRAIPPGANYRASAVLSLWKKSFLTALLRPGENAWEFELAGSIRSDPYDGFYCAGDNHLKVVNAVIKGKWDRQALRKMHHLGIKIDTKRRKTQTLWEGFEQLLRVKRRSLLIFVPIIHRRSTKDFIRKIFRFRQRYS